MKIYLAARYSRMVEMRGYAEHLEAAGHVVTSRWITGVHDTDIITDEHQALCANDDLRDLIESDCVISFTDGDNAATRRSPCRIRHSAGFTQTAYCRGSS